MTNYAIVGKRVPAKEAIPKATGEAKYGDDWSFSQMLFGAILRSPYPHARILRIDTSRAERRAGVKAIITGKETAGMAAKGAPFGHKQYQEILALDKVRFAGEPVAALAAVDEDMAREALELVQVEYEELPAIFDPEEAMQPGAPVIHDHAPHNVMGEKVLEYGDVEEGFRVSHLVREDKFVTQRVTHGFTEPHVVTANYETAGKLTMWASKMNIRGYVAAMASMLGLSEGDVRAINAYAGGSFGGKTGLQMTHDAIAALLSIKTGRPVKVSLSREEVFYNVCRTPITMHLKTGIKKDGTLMATECTAIIDGGAYAGIGITTAFHVGKYLSAPYRIPHLRFKGYRAYTNNLVGGPQRAPGIPQIFFALESQLDMLAEELGMDPVELRLKNAAGPTETNPLEVKFISCGLRECIQKATEAISSKEKHSRARRRGAGIAVGMTHCGWTLPFPGFRVPRLTWPVHIKLHENGRVSVYAVTMDAGQESGTVLCQVVAEELGIPLVDVSIPSRDSAMSPADRMATTGGSAYSGGKAAAEAARDLKRQIFEIVADKLECSPHDLEAKDGRISVKGSPEASIPFSEAALAVFAAKGSILGRGAWVPTKDARASIEKGKADTDETYTFMAYAAEVEVDPDTGKVTLEKLAGAYDCGFAINPMFVEGQIEGGMAMGTGYAMTEELLQDKEGRALNLSSLDYRMPTALDMPDIKSILVEPMDLKEGPFGAKEGGEGTAVATAPAIANAIYDALGVRITDLPITPEKILRALEKGRQG